MLFSAVQDSGFRNVHEPVRVTMVASSMTFSWTGDETFCLIDAWGDETIQALLEGRTRNRHVYEKIARELEELSPPLQ